jgi:hypothetical protein
MIAVKEHENCILRVAVCSNNVVSQTVYTVEPVSTQAQAAQARICCMKEYMYSAVVKIVTSYVITIGTARTGVVHKVLLFSRRVRRICILLFTLLEMVWFICLCFI